MPAVFHATLNKPASMHGLPNELTAIHYTFDEPARTTALLKFVWYLEH
jgi:hypothetical protein